MKTNKDFLRAFPETCVDWSTGGGCTAWMIPLPNGHHVLLTDDNLGHPTWRDRKIAVGLYDGNGDTVEDSHALTENMLTWNQAAKLVAGWKDQHAALERVELERIRASLWRAHRGGPTCMNPDAAYLLNILDNRRIGGGFLK